MYRQHYSTKQVPQSQPIPNKDMVKNNAGGYVFQIDDWKRLDRFLILGSEGGSYYVNEKELTIHNAEAVARCIKEDGPKVVSRIVEISDAGRAPKNNPALFALAMCAGMGNLETRRLALDSLPKVARIGTHLFLFAEYVEGFRGWGRGLRQAVAKWYNEMPVNRLAYQVIKYQQREGWSHRDLLRLSHPKADTPQHNALYEYVVKGKADVIANELNLIEGFERAKIAENKKQIISLIDTYGLTREMIPTQWLNETDVWSALLPKMPLTALIRNLGKMTNVGLLKPMSTEAGIVVSKLSDKDYILKSRLHPLSILVALKTYQQGYGVKGSLSWKSVREIVDALDEAFYLSFDNAETTGKRWVLALDVSGSMSSGNIAGLPITPREATAAMALVTARVEKQYWILAFSSGLIELDISSRQRLGDVIRTISSLPFSSTDCALPMLGALKQNIGVDNFVIYTDNETWSGNIHPVQALQQYRQKMNIASKLVTVGMTASGLTIADPDDFGMLDVVGFDTATPQVISDFGR